jgi:DNA-binding transcriptional MerR regulator
MGEAARLRDDSSAPERTYAIGELAEEFGLTLRTIRHYEDEGLLSPGREGTVRVYGHRDRARLALICRGKRLGFSLAEIKEFLGLYDSGGAQVGQMRYLRRLARQRIAALRQQLADVQQTLTELTDIDDQITRHLRRQGADDTMDEEGSRS